MYTVLYVDDEPTLLEIGRHFLELGGQFTVDTIDSAPGALALLDAKTYDAIVSDYQMPGMDGIEFLKKVRSSGNTIPFILFTGRGREEIVIQALNEGADFYLQKGGDPRSQFAELTHKVQVAVEHHRSAETIQSLNRLYSVLSATNRAMVHLRTKSAFFSEICRVLVETGGFRMAWIGLVFPEQKAIRPVASAGHIDGYLDHIDISTEDVPRGRGPTGTAYREGKYFFSNDITLDPLMEPWRANALKRGYRANAAFPFAPGTKNAGVISVYAPVTGFFNDRVIGLLGELAIDVSFALMTMDDEENRKAAEDALRDHERREADIINFLPDATFAIDRSGRVITWNHAIEEMTGVPAAEMLGKGDYEYAIPFYGERQPILIDLIYEPDEVIAKKYSNIRHRKDTLIADTALPHPRGKPLTLMAKAGPLYNRQGEVVGAIESIRDISEMKKAEEGLRESEGRFAAFMDHLPVTAFIKDENSTNLFVNRRMVESFGEQEWIGKSVYEQFPKDAAETMIADDQQTLRDGSRKTIENLALKNGERKIFETYKFRIDRGSKPPLIGGFAVDITEQKRAEDALRASEEKYRSTIDAFPDAVSVVDPELRVILANTGLLSWLRSLGFSDDIIGKPIREAFPFLPPGVLDEYRTVFSTGIAMVSEESSKIGNAEIRTETRKIPLREHGDIVAVVAIIRDVTERKRAEDAVRESEERYRNVIEDQTEFISRFLPDGTHVFVNEAYCRYFGLERDRTLGHRFRPQIPPGDRERVKRFFASLTPDHPVDAIEHRIIMPDGSIRWQRWSDRAIFDPSGRVREYQSVGRDVTERKEEEQVRHENEQRLDSIYNTVGDSIFQLSVEPGGQYRFTSVNAAFCRTTGLPPGDVIGRTVNEIIPEPSLSLVLEKYRQAIAEKAIVRWEETSPYPTGQLTGEVSVSPIFDSAGTCTHLIGSVHDITDRKRAEEELLKKIEELNASYEQITASEEELRTNVEELTLREQELRESEARFRLLFNSGRDAIAVHKMGEDGRPTHFIQVNDIACERLGYTREEMLRLSPQDIDAPDCAGQMPAIIEKLLKTGYVLFETVQVAKDGRRIPVEVSSVLFPLEGSPATMSVARDITERKRAEAGLRESEERFRTIFENQQNGLFMVDAETHVIVDINRNALSLIGATPEDVIGRVCHTFICPAEKGKCPVTDLGQTVDMSERALFNIKGEQIPVIKSVSRVALGGHAYLIESITDITERKRAEAELREREETFRSLVQESTDGIIITDEEGRVIVWNDAATRITGIPGDEARGNLFADLAVSEMVLEHRGGGEADRIRAGIGTALRTGTGAFFSPVGDAEILRRDGERRSIRQTGFPIRTAKGFRIGAIIRDVTGQRRVGEVLRKSEAQLKRAEEVGRSGSWEFRLGENAVGVSDGARLLYGLEGTHWTIDEVQKLPLPEYRPLLDKAMKDLIAGTAPYDVEFRIRRRNDGAVLDIHSLAEYDPVRNAVFGVIHDITGRKQEAEALRQANKKLGLLSSITRHDINNQITVLQSYLAILEKEECDPADTGKIRKIAAAAERISAIIRFTKQYEAIGVHDPDWQDCSALVGETARRASLGKVVVKNDIPAGVEVFADPLVAAVFYNLAENAVRHGGKITTIRFSVGERDGTPVLVCEDDGDGIPAGEKERIFDRGFGKNTGLGLTLAREILSITGITIRETGVPGRGAQFEMTVPVKGYRGP